MKTTSTKLLFQIFPLSLLTISIQNSHASPLSDSISKKQHSPRELVTLSSTSLASVSWWLPFFSDSNFIMASGTNAGNGGNALGSAGGAAGTAGAPGATGGAGGNSNLNGANAPSGGFGGQAGTIVISSGAGGLGANTGGGNGGNGLALGASGRAGGGGGGGGVDVNTGQGSGGGGGAGGLSTINNTSGGGGGGGGGGIGATTSIANNTGGTGGNGGNGVDTAGGGGGGAGGTALVLTGFPNAVVTFLNTGGNGGAGGNGNTRAALGSGGGGGGGAGGYGVVFSGNLLTLQNQVIGGNGGAGGAANTAALTGTAGVGGHAVVINSGDLMNENIITGGIGGAGAAATIPGAGGGIGALGGFGVTLTSGTVGNSGTITGGRGGNGGAGANGANGAAAGANGANGGIGGSAGAGASGISMTSGNINNTGTISGANGGTGGIAGTGGNGGNILGAGNAGNGGNATNSGNGGIAGHGIVGSNLIINNTGSIIGGTGGNGGAGGVGGIGGSGFLGGNGGNGGNGSNGGNGGGAGNGIVGSNLTLINDGSIAAGTAGIGGLGGAGGAGGIGGVGGVSGNSGSSGLTGAAGKAILFTSGTNRLELRSGSVITGDVVANGLNDTLALGGTTNSNFSVSGLGSQYQGFEFYEKTGTSVWTLTGTTTSITSWLINAGTLSISSDSNLGNLSGGLVFNGGTLQNTAGFASNRSVTLNANGGTVQTNADLTLAGNISGTGALTKEGASTLTLTGTNNYLGGTTITTGTLQLGDGGATGSLVGDILNNSNLIINRTGTLTLSGLISGVGSLIKQGSSMLELAGINTYTGATTVSAGELRVTGNIAGSDVAVQSGATLSGGDGSVLGNNITIANGATLLGRDNEMVDIAGNALLNPTSQLNLVLGGPNGHALFGVNGNLTLDGQLNITPATGFGPGVYHVFTYQGSLTNNDLMTGSSDLFVQTSIPHEVNLVNSTGVSLNFWDGANPSNKNNNQVDGGNGIWNLSNDNWTDMSGAINAPYQPLGAFAIFQGASGIVSIDNIDGQVSASGLQFAVTGYRVEGDTLELMDAATIRVGEGTQMGALMTSTIASGIIGNMGLNKTDLGTLVLEGINTYTGNTSINGGTLSVTSDNNLGDLSGGIVFNGGSLLNTAAFTSNRSVTLNATGGRFITNADLTLTGNVNGVGGLTKDGANALLLNTNNAYTGGTIIHNGRLVIGTAGGIASSSGVNLNASGAVLDLSPLLLGQATTIQDLSGVMGSQVAIDDSILNAGTSNSTEFAGQFTGSGGLNKQGTGTLLLSGDSSLFTGNTVVSNGTLTVNGQLGGLLSVAQSSVLKGTGTVGTTTVNGTIKPGNSIGTLTVNGDYIQNLGSTYEVEINPQGNSDLIQVLGNATINGGLVSVVEGAGNYQPIRYTILTAVAGVSGVYDGLIQTMPFLTYELHYDLNSVYLDIVRSAMAFSSLAITPNQIATANAVTSLGMGNPVYNALMNVSNANQAQQAFNALSGEAHSSIIGTWLEDTRYVRHATLDRLDQALTSTDNSLNDKFGARSVISPTGVALWGQAFGAWGQRDSNGNAASVSRDTSGLFLGADKDIGSSIRAGILGGYSKAHMAVNERYSKANSNDYYLGLYAGKKINRWITKSGAVYTWHELDMNRAVNFKGFSDALKSDYNGHTAQIFAELAYDTPIKRMMLQPFAGLAYVDTRSGHWSEKGGLAALGGNNSADVFYSSLGAKQSMALYAVEQASIYEKIALAWRHAYSDTAFESTFYFTGGGLPFGIQGAPIAKDSLLIDAGATLELPAKRVNLRLAYLGQVAAHVQDNGLSATLSYSFD